MAAGAALAVAAMVLIPASIPKARADDSAVAAEAGTYPMVVSVTGGLNEGGTGIIAVNNTGQRRITVVGWRLGYLNDAPWVGLVMTTNNTSFTY